MQCFNNNNGWFLKPFLGTGTLTRVLASVLGGLRSRVMSVGSDGASGNGPELLEDFPTRQCVVTRCLGA